LGETAARRWRSHRAPRVLKILHISIDICEVP
jgi:hypothetical protein